MLAYMGDKKSSCDANMLAAELVAIAMNSPQDALRSEVYVQIMKQLTNNPSPQSERLGWRLFGLLCKFVKPPEEFEDYVLTFVMQRKPRDSQRFISTFHELLYRGRGENYEPPLRPPASGEVGSIMDKLDRRDYRSRYSMKEVVQQHKKFSPGGAERRRNGSRPAPSKYQDSKDDDEDEDDGGESPPPAPRRAGDYGGVVEEEGGGDGDDDDDDEEENAKEVLADDTPLEVKSAGYDFEPMDDTMIALKEGDRVAILVPPEDDGWVYVHNETSDETGYVPENYLE